MKERELRTLNKAEKLIALLKDDKELREKLKSDRPEIRREVLDKIDMEEDEMERFLAALEAISAQTAGAVFWG